MMGIRPPAAAGTFYPAGPRELKTYIETALSEAAREPLPKEPVKAIIAPHAGYVYSGAIAARAFAAAGRERDIRRVVLLGPAHTMAFTGLAAPASEGFATPLGVARVDRTARDEIAALPQVIIDDAPHAREHSLEVELPFIQTLFPAAPVLPLVVGEATPAEVAEIIDLLDDGHTLFVVSSDLSHYEPYETAHTHDAMTARRIGAFDGAHIGPRDACGARPLAGLLRAAREKHWRPRLLDLRNSGDTAGDRSRVVGYGAWAFTT